MADNNFSTHLKVVLGESVIASSAATLSVVAFEVPVWAMFVGWISYFTRGLNLKQGVINLTCVFIGVTLGIAATHVVVALTPMLGGYAISAVVFAITVLALSLAKAPVFNNLLGFFLGLVAYFASHQPPSITTFGMLALAATLGATAAFLAHALQKSIYS
ncbi:DUF1097 domain-containing protein [Pollutimonas harenae]|uniref:DUF1097 domain-containing protein n=1 Tax=Pollutimonas harenae TaxID=657015 RepID=A0A853GU44_9BURK|nr:DUF1097 domain-containing protein [Pollutimonas harenae]NYT84306.1 DUF1097 domain-containing protein [Pollutimonas harenae]TEA73289.1 DUF1097 domain-containing protein [Pollutimonas harenae]